MKKILAIAALPLLLTACTSEFDMHGHDPKAYYKEHPIKNKVETRNESHTAHFAPGSNRLTPDAVDALQASLRNISPMAVDTVQVQMHPSQTYNSARKESISKMFRRMGYGKSTVMFEPSDSLERNDVRFDVTYAVVVGPRCPDWRTSPVTTYSNTQQGGFRCANETNLGLMVADPRDLERGTGQSSPDLMRNSVVLENYRANKGAGQDSTTSAEVNATTSADQQ